MKRIIIIVGIVVVLLLGALAAVPFLINPNDFRPMLESNLSDALGRQVKLGNLGLSILHGAVTAADLAVADDPAYSHTPFVQAKSLKVAVELWPLITSRKLNVTGLEIDQPQIVLMQGANGEWNFSNLGGNRAASQKKVAAPSEPAGKPLDLSVKLVKITNGRFTLGRTGAHAQPLVLEQVNAELRDFSNSSEFPFSFSTKVLGGGEINLEGKAGPINQDDVAMTAASASLKVTALDLTGTGLTQMAPAMAGLISLDGSGGTDGKTAHVKGRIKAEKMKLAAHGTRSSRVLELDFDVEHHLKNRAGRLTEGDIHIGAAVARLTGSYAQQGDAVLIKMNLAGQNMPIPELAAMLPVIGMELPAGSTLQGGTANLKVAMEGPVDRLVTSGSLAFNNTRLAGFNLPSKMETIERLAGIHGGPDTEIQTLSANLRIAPDGMSAEAVQLMVPVIGNLDGGGTISPANALDFKMRVTLHTAALASMINNTPIPFTIQGTAAQPVFRPDVRAVVNEKVKSLEGGAAKTAGGLLRDFLGGKKN
ncbi:MAG TPA: AsmA family protein [Candidatus Acidoferrales bacterium]|jgi:AsmA protein|nr:AsmA family protein [Candidatus Acidoferrales bacterium]